MDIKDVRNAIAELRKSVSECSTNSVILSSTASMNNTSLFFQDKIDNDTFNKNGSEIASLAAEFMLKCKCVKK